VWVASQSVGGLDRSSLLVSHLFCFSSPLSFEVLAHPASAAQLGTKSPFTLEGHRGTHRRNTPVSTRDQVFGRSDRHEGFPKALKNDTKTHFRVDTLEQRRNFNTQRAG
jgi:hypothetical protein